MRYSDQIDMVARQSVSDADSACKALRRAVQQLQTAPKRANLPDGDEFLAQAARDGAVTPRVLVPADHAGAAPHARPSAPDVDREQPEQVHQQQVDDEPGFGTGWLSAR